MGKYTGVPCSKIHVTIWGYLAKIMLSRSSWFPKPTPSMIPLFIVLKSKNNIPKLMYTFIQPHFKNSVKISTVIVSGGEEEGVQEKRNKCKLVIMF
jgi:hypothetical protein